MTLRTRISRLLFAGRTFLVVNFARARHYPVRASVIALAIIGVMYLILSGNTSPDVAQVKTETPLVTVMSIAELSSSGDSLTVIGEVRSVSQAELRAQKSGKITRVYVTAGQYVAPGTLLAEIDSAGERAAVLSAQGLVVGAEAQLAKARAGARSEDRVSASASADSAAISLSAAEEGARSAYSQAYAIAADAITAQADDFFSNSYTVNPSFRVRTADYDERTTLEKDRVALGDILTVWQKRTQVRIPSTDLDSALIEAESNLNRVKQLLNSISAYVSEQAVGDDISAGDKATQEATLLGARSSVDGGRSAVLGARQALAGARSAQIAASTGESKIAIGERPEDLRSAEAGVLQARGALASASAALENALIRSPIGGTVTTFNVSIGDFVSAFQSIAVVANPSALEVEGYVSGTTRDRLMVGAPTLVDGTYAGTITTLAPGLDPDTKKARFTVGLSSDAQLTNGQSVTVALTGTTTPSTTTFSIPLASIKVLPNGLAVFSVRDDGTLETHAIKEGAIVGDRMILHGDVSPTLNIVTDVRGLRENEKVEVTQ